MQNSMICSVSLLEANNLVIPQGLLCQIDGPPGQRVMFLSDEEETFTISFEEGMELMDMRPLDHLSESPVLTLCATRNGKYIHYRRISNGKGNFAFFHFEIEDKDGSILKIPGQMTARPDYPWSDTIEPVLLAIVDGISIR